MSSTADIPSTIYRIVFRFKRYFVFLAPASTNARGRGAKNCTLIVVARQVIALHNVNLEMLNQSYSHCTNSLQYYQWYLRTILHRTSHYQSRVLYNQPFYIVLGKFVIYPIAMSLSVSMCACVCVCVCATFVSTGHIKAKSF